LINDTPSRPRYSDRMHAGYELAVELRRFLDGRDPIILAIPRGGVPVATAIAHDLRAPLDLIVPRRIPAPDHPDMTLGAITPDRTLVVNKALAAELHISDEELEQLSIPVWAEVQRTQQLYRGGRAYPDLRGHAAVIVDDRLTTGYTMIAAVISARKMEPAGVVVAVPVSSLEGLERVRGYVDDLLSLEITNDVAFPMSQYYASAESLSDREVTWDLERFWSERPPDGYSETF
jgi:putative phosphoribosyl transferase